MDPKLYLPSIPLESTVGRLIVELEPVRNRSLNGSTPPWIFFELKNLFQTIESIASTRIEGNHTTVAEFVEAVREDEEVDAVGEQVREIINVEGAIAHIEQLQKEDKLVIDKQLLLDLHRMVVKDLNPRVEGDTRPGAYRNEPRSVGRHQTPPWADVPQMMDALIAFINEETPPQLQLIKTAVAHHRFVWIHPFGNGNGRAVRLLTYAMLAKYGFIDAKGRRLLVPTAVLGNDKERYWSMLESADALTDESLIAWCEFMLTAIRDETLKVDRLLDVEFTRKSIILPALDFALDKQRINTQEYEMLKIAADKYDVMAKDFALLFPNVSQPNISQAIKKLRDQRLLRPRPRMQRKYSLRFTRNSLTLGVIMQLKKHGFLPISDEDDA